MCEINKCSGSWLYMHILHIQIYYQDWKEVLELTPLILQKLYSTIEPGPHDVCMILDAQQRVHYLNKRTGVTTTEPPLGFVPAALEREKLSVMACQKACAEVRSSFWQCWNGIDPMQERTSNRVAPVVDHAYVVSLVFLVPISTDDGHQRR